MKRFIASILCAFMLVSTFPKVTFAEEITHDVTETKTFPQVQKYTTDKNGYFTIGSTSRFYILESEATLDNTRLYNDVKLISSEFASKNIASNKVLDIVIGPENKIKNGDIVVSIEPILETDNEEGYKVEIKEDIIKITSSNVNGLFYGMRTVEKALIGNNGRMNLGTIVDYPETSVRSFHLDLARKYFTKDWIISMIKDLSYQNISSIQIHFSENEGFRLESSVLENEIPGFTYPSDGYYTKSDMKEIIDTARKYHIEVVPSLDTPGHLGYVLNQITSKVGKDYTVKNLFPTDSRRNQTFNIFESEDARNLLLDLIEEYASFFSENGSTRMNIGGDEFLANFTAMNNDQYKSVIDYFNDASKVVKKYGMKARAWNDGLLVKGYDGYELDSDIEICYWGLGTGSAPVSDFIENGNSLVNYVDAYMYYALSPWWMQYANPKGEKIYGEWEPGKMNSLPGGISQDFTHPYPEVLLGASYALWCDIPNYQSQDTIATNLYMRTRSMADKVWSPKASKVSYSEFETFVSKIDRVPGYKEELPLAKDVIHVDNIEEDDREVSNLTANELSSLVLPIVQSYEVASKAYLWKMNENTRFVIPNAEEYLDNSRLKEVLNLVSAEFLEKKIPSAMEISKVYALEEEITSSDIVITIDKTNPITDKSSSSEAYRIEIGNNGVKIIAASENAVIYALRTIQHFMITNNNSLVYGTIVDYPNLAERRVHVDMARKYISKDWIIQHIRELSYMKMNTIQLHFSENLGFRIESDFDPEIVSQDGYLKKAEIKEILEEARLYGVNVIPSLDTPGHVEHILKVHPEYGQVDKNGNKSTVALDVTNPEAISYIKGLYSEYIELFEGCTDFHIGADEYMEFDRAPFTTNYKSVLNTYAVEKFGAGYTWKDVIANYINEIAELVHEGGFKPRIWNDGIYYGENSSAEAKQQIKMKDYIGIDFWSQMSWNPSIAKLNTFIQKGHKDIYNINASYFYYVLRTSAPTDGRTQHSFDYLNQDARIYNEWTPGKFQGNTIDDNSEVIRGASLAIWCDKPDLVGEDVITEDIAKELRSLATKSWNVKSNSIASLDKFKENYAKLGNAAGFEKGYKLPEVEDVVPSKDLGKVILKYVSSTGKVLKEDVVKYGIIGEDYTFEADEIYGYSVTNEVFSGKFDKEEQVYTFVYELSTDKTELNNEIDNSLKENLYIRETYNEYKEALEKARKISENNESEQIEVDNVLTELLASKKKAVLLEYYPLYIETEYPLNNDGYVSGYDEYLTAVKNGKATLYSEDINIDSMKEAFNSIKDAKEDLKKKDGNVPSVTATDKTYTHSGAAWQGPYFPPEKYALANMVDGNLETKTWFADNQNIGDEIVFSFAKQLNMSKIQIVQPSDVGADLIVNADIEVATEKGTWTKVGTLTTADGRDKTIEFEEAPVQFVRIIIRESASKWYQIAEVYFTYEQEEEVNTLKNIIIEAQELDITNKDLKLLSNMVDILIEAQKAYIGNLDNALEIEVNLREAIDNLQKEIEEVIKDHLEIAVEEAEKITEEELSKVIPIVVAEFKEALKEAKELLEDEDVTQEQIDASFDRLSKAMHMLSFEKGNKNAINSLIEKINKLEESEYIKETWDKMKVQLDAAIVVVENENALESEVSEAYKDLIKAFLDLRLKPNKDKLKYLIDKLESEVNKEDYTTESWNYFELALEKAKTIYEDENSNQESIDLAVAELIDAKEKLVASNDNPTEDEDDENNKPGENNNNKPGSDENNNDTNTDVDNDNNSNTDKDNSGNGANVNNNDDNYGKGNVKLPSTGAVISSALILVLAIGLTVGGVILVKRKKVNE